MEDSTRLSRCPRCGAELVRDAPQGLCPGCLFAAAIGSDSQVTSEPTSLLREGDAGAPEPLASLLPAGAFFGAYRIERLLGQGGMGDVYEAEHVGQGRRVALKVLNQRLTRPEDRARFLREGQLAASVNHPHVCYVFGSEEILGVPAIAMELLPGGTLKDRVQKDGPLPSTQAVDAILQVIAGLDAAQQAGILHRDVKPANCFVDSDGSVKIGDFGLSISTSTRDLSQLAAGGFQGTPQFAAPEQLRGEALDVRSDIYAVGVTLYYLLTGVLPYGDADLGTLVTRVTSDAPRSPRAVRSTVPRGLDRIVRRCLAKQRLDRLQNYAALEDALRLFASNAATPATMSLRFLALLADRAVLAVATTPVTMMLAAKSGGFLLDRSFVFAQYVLVAAYYAVQEGVWGATLGKRAVGLQVTDRQGQAAGLARTTGRALIFASPMFLSELPVLVSGRASLSDPAATWPGLPAFAFMAYWVTVALLFSTARRRNGFAGVHELLSGTRVVRRVERRRRPTLDLAGDLVTTRVSAAQYGPYTAAGAFTTTGDGALLRGCDPRLRRPVWIHVLTPGAPAIPRQTRSLSRPARLRWLGGQRLDGLAWDAYEALDGAPFLSVTVVSQPWGVVKHWLHDLATEIDAARHDGSPPTLALERIWITRDGRARLLDFAIPGEEASTLLADPASIVSAQTFLALVARRALHLSDLEGGERTLRHVPLAASRVLRALTAHTFATTEAVASSLRALLGTPDRVTRGRRAASVLLCAVLPAALALTLVGVVVLGRGFGMSEVEELRSSLRYLSKLPQPAHGEAAIEREALEVYIAGRFGPMLSDPAFWENPFRSGSVMPMRPVAQRIIAERGVVSPDELAKVQPRLARFLRTRELEIQTDKDTPTSAIAAMVAAISSVLFVAVALVASAVLRGGLLLTLFGIAVVADDGAQVPRRRALGRAVMAWSPVLMLAPAAFPGLLPSWATYMWQSAAGSMIVLALAAALLLGGALWAILHPERGLQDWLAGTWLVPR